MIALAKDASLLFYAVHLLALVEIMESASDYRRTKRTPWQDKAGC